MLNLISNLSPLGALSDTLAPQPILGHVEELWIPKAQIPGLPPLLSPEGDRALCYGVTQQVLDVDFLGGWAGRLAHPNARRFLQPTAIPVLLRFVSLKVAEAMDRVT